MPPKETKYDWRRVPMSDKDYYLDTMAKLADRGGSMGDGPMFKALREAARVPLRTKAEVDADKLRTIDAYHQYVYNLAGRVDWNGLSLNSMVPGSTYAEALNRLYAEETSD